MSKTPKDRIQGTETLRNKALSDFNYMASGLIALSLIFLHIILHIIYHISRYFPI